MSAISGDQTVDSEGDTPMATSTSTPEFKLTNVLIGHSAKDVRCIFPLSDGAFVTGGRDQTMCIWEPKGNMYIEKFQSFQTSWVNAVCELPPLPNATNSALQHVGGVVAGLKDGTLAIHDRQAKLLYQLPGHTNQVSSLSVTADGLLISGSWDGTMKVWDLTTETCVHTQSEFENAVTVLALPNGDIATGSSGVQTGPAAVGQMKIRIFTPNGDGHYTLSKTVEDHQHKITELTTHGVGFASTSNDGTTNLRTLDGQVVQQIINPTGEWGLSLTSLKDTGELAVAHDDGVLQVWAGETLQQMLVHPRGIWSVKQLANGDLVTGCPQGKITIWSRNVERQADEEFITAYNSATFSTRSMNAAKMGKQLDVHTLPKAEDKQQHVGSKDGELSFSWGLRGGGGSSSVHLFGKKRTTPHYYRHCGWLLFCNTDNFFFFSQVTFDNLTNRVRRIRFVGTVLLGRGLKWASPLDPPNKKWTVHILIVCCRSRLICLDKD